MSRLTGLVDAVVADPVVAAALEQAREPAGTTLDLSAPGAIRPVLYAALAAAADRGGADRPVLAVTATFREAEELTEALRCLVDDPASVVYYPAWETLPHERLSPRSDTVGRRLAVLRRLVHPDPSDETTGPVRILVAPVRSVLQPQVKGLADLKPVQLHVGDTTELEDLIEGLAGAAYHRVDLVERRGEFAVRGGIIDVFPPTEEHPLRVDFFGDEVEEIRYFAVADQRSLELAEHGLWAPPCRELLLTDEVRRRAAALAKEHPELAELFEKLSQGHAVEGMESLAPVLVDEMELLVDLMPKGTHVVVSDPERVRARAHDLVATSQEFLEASWAAAAGGGQAPIDLGAAAYMTLADVRTHALGNELSWWSLSPFATAPADAPELRDSLGERVSIDIDADAGAVESRIVEARELEPYRGQTEPAMNDVRDWLRAGWRVVTITEGHGPAARLAEVFGEHELAARTVDAVDTVPEPGVVQIAQGTIEHGFVAPGIRLAVLTENDLVGQRTTADRRDASRMPSRRKKTIDPLELTPGDFVVHEQHGVGRYVEMMQRTVGSGQQGVTREYLVIEFAPSKRGQPGDRLYVPTDQLDQVTRYVGGEQPSLDRMGGSDWARRKGRARKAVRQIAAELIKLYAARQATKGHAFGPDTPWQRELEDAFPFVETPDQAATIDDVKRDMEKVTPMDRVVCGDVGYGKTEIAVRAAFKAVQDGKQVAVLVPTTLLVQQHYATFAERYAAFPVNVRPLSRFQTDSEAKATIEGLASGSVDVVIGTHRLLSGEIRFKDLGLVVIDEEQRFGVDVKERLKTFRATVDVLTLSATPIPRTLHMSLVGLRDISNLETPPEDRLAVDTKVARWDENAVRHAVLRELARGGQIYFVHNRVNDIELVASRLRRIVPEARLRIGHAQMSDDELEDVMVGFVAGK
ncbi:MAG TPA: DEAD/DEAH box helicase, partial [Kribbellaceae bacterium]|nr:DEAD/DEAH box helicase [Kribbellaceae bacterium]